MSTVNKPNRFTAKTHEGAPAVRITAYQELRRTLMSCLLWEDTFYESGGSIADRMANLVPRVLPGEVASLAMTARNEMHLRHAPLLIVREMCKYPEYRRYVAQALEYVIRRPDELTEFLALYWKDGKQPLASSVKKGLAAAFRKFSAYQLAKYNRSGAVKLKDVLFLCHPKPADLAQQGVWDSLVAGTLPTPDTWESNLAAGKDKKETFERLLAENKLGGLALLRNLRGMTEANVDKLLIRQALQDMNTSRILPFRFIAAAKYAPEFEPLLETSMFKNLSEMQKLPGTTILLVDVSGSMDTRLSAKSEMTRLEAAAGLAMMLREVCESVGFFAFSDDLTLLPPRRGFAMRDLLNQQRHGGTKLGAAVAAVSEIPHDRLIVITDEQSQDRVTSPTERGYMVNVASNQNGVGYHGYWTHIDGWSEAIVRYVLELEKGVADAGPGTSGG